MMHINSETSNH